MLVLSRKTGEKVVVPACDLKITILGIRGKRVRLGISAPPTTTVLREEVCRREREPALAGAERRS